MTSNTTPNEDALIREEMARERRSKMITGIVALIIVAAATVFLAVYFSSAAAPVN